MRIAWVPVLAGAAMAAGGVGLSWLGWSQVAGGDLTAPGLASLAAGVLLTLLGVLMLAIPLTVPVLYKLYGPEAFTTRGGSCPVVAKCARCGEFNFRSRPACKHCASPLVWDAKPAA
jgi:hypothetical protein